MSPELQKQIDRYTYLMNKHRAKGNNEIADAIARRIERLQAEGGSNDIRDAYASMPAEQSAPTVAAPVQATPAVAQQSANQYARPNAYNTATADTTGNPATTTGTGNEPPVPPDYSGANGLDLGASADVNADNQWQTLPSQETVGLNYNGYQPPLSDQGQNLLAMLNTLYPNKKKNQVEDDEYNANEWQDRQNSWNLGDPRFMG